MLIIVESKITKKLLKQEIQHCGLRTSWLSGRGIFFSPTANAAIGFKNTVRTISLFTMSIAVVSRPRISKRDVLAIAIHRCVCWVGTRNMFRFH